MSSNLASLSPTKITAYAKRQTVSTRTIRQLNMQDAYPLTKRNTKNSLAIANDQAMSMEDLELLEDFGYSSQLKKNTRSRLESLQISKQKLKHLTSVLVKEPHEKTNKEIEELRKILQEVPFFQQFMTKNEEHLSQYDINDLSKLLIYERLEPGEEIQLYGEESSQMYLILKGKVALARPIKNRKSAPLEELDIEGTFQTQMKLQGARRAKLVKGETQVVSAPVKSSQVMFNGIACRFLVTVDVADEHGNIQKVKQPHPIYNEVAEMQRVLDNMKFQTLQTPAFREKLDQTIMQTAKVTASEQAFKQKMENTITARREREESHFKRSNNVSETRHPTHESHLHAHQLHMERLRTEQDHIEQIIFHNKPTIVPHDKSFLMQKTSGQVKYSMKNSIDTVGSKSQDLDIDKQKESSVQLLVSEVESQSVVLAIASTDPMFDSESSLSDGDLPIDYDEQDYPTEEIFDHLVSGQYFGQLSLSENSQGKRASVYTKTTTHLIIIERIAFQKMLVLHQKRHEAELLTFLKTIPLLRSFPNSQLKKLVCYFTPVNKIVNSYLYRENEPSTHVYIVKEGEFRVTRRVQKQQEKNEPHPKDVYADPRKSMKGQSKYFVKNIVNHYENVELQKIGKCQLVGDEDCAMSNKYNTTVQCISQTAKLIVITREDFRRIESQGVQWNSILSNGESKIRKYHEKMRQYQFIMLHVDDEMNKVKAVANGSKIGENKYIAGEDLLKQHWDSVKRPSGEMVENPLFQSSKLEVNLEQLISRRVPQQILQIKPENRNQNLRQEQQALQSSALTNYNKIQTLDEPVRERKISTAAPNSRRPPLPTKLLGTQHKANAFSQVFDKYLAPNFGGTSQLVSSTNPSQKVARNNKGFSTADTVQSLNTRKLQTTAYLKLKENFKTRSQGQSLTTTKNIKYSISWNLSPTQNQPPQRLPINLNNII